MAHVIMVDHPDVTPEKYDEVQAVLGDGLPEGCLAHVAGPGPDGWRVITVWESPEKSQAFMQNVLAPAFEKAGVAQLTSPPTTWPLYRLLT